MSKEKNAKKSPYRSRSREQSTAERAINLFCSLVALLINAFVLVCMTEIINRRGGSSTVAWLVNHQDLFLAGFLFVFAWSLFFAFLTARTGFAVWFVNFTLLLLVTIHMYKWQLRGEPLLMTDFSQAKEAAAVLPNFKLSFPGYLAVSALLLLLINPLLAWKFTIRLSSRLRAVVSLLTLVLAAAVSYTELNLPGYIPFRAKEVYQERGFIHGFWETRPRNALVRPPEYDQDTVLSEYANALAEEKEPEIKPDIFFVMSESLFDLYGTGKLEITQDPLAAIKELQKEYAGGEYIAPFLGGGTYSSEYEVLTGYRATDTSKTLFNDRSVTFPGMPSVVSALQKAGYTTTAFHPNSSSFYNRAFNYTRFGFERLMFNDTGLEEITDRIGKYPRDEALFHLVLKDYEQRDKEKPWFCHIVTFQNHGDYSYDYDRRDIRVLNRDGLELKNAENYENAVLEHVEAFLKLIDYLDKQERPAVVVLWGDHAPNVGLFGMEFGTGRALSQYYKTPLLIWNNYDQDFSLGEEAIAGYRLGAFVLSRIGIRSDPYLNWLADCAKPDLSQSLHMIEEDGAFFEDEEQYEKMNAVLLLLHYDRLLGEHYWELAEKGSTNEKETGG